MSSSLDGNSLTSELKAMSVTDEKAGVSLSRQNSASGLSRKNSGGSSLLAEEERPGLTQGDLLRLQKARGSRKGGGPTSDGVGSKGSLPLIGTHSPNTGTTSPDLRVTSAGGGTKPPPIQEKNSGGLSGGLFASARRISGGGNNGGNVDTPPGSATWLSRLMV